MALRSLLFLALPLAPHIAASKARPTSIEARIAEDAGSKGAEPRRPLPRKGSSVSIFVAEEQPRSPLSRTNSLKEFVEAVRGADGDQFLEVEANEAVNDAERRRRSSLRGAEGRVQTAAEEAARQVVAGSVAAVVGGADAVADTAPADGNRAAEPLEEDRGAVSGDDTTDEDV